MGFKVAVCKVVKVLVFELLVKETCKVVTLLAYKSKSRFLFIPDNLEYLQKGGRIGRASAILGNLFKIIPILTVEDGITSIYKKIRTKQKAVNNMIEKVLEDASNHGGLEEIVVHHIDNIEEAKLVAERLKDILSINTIAIHDIGPVIGLHVGPGTIAIAYYTKEKMR